MDYTIKIIIIRHGHSLGNQTKTFLGHYDLDLSEIGIKQAEKTAEYLKNEKIDCIFSSDLLRAVNTAAPHAVIHGLDVNKSELFREVCAGEWENRQIDDIIAEWGREVFYDQWVNNFGCFTFPSGESIRAAGKRFYNELYRICDNINEYCINSADLMDDSIDFPNKSSLNPVIYESKLGDEAIIPNKTILISSHAAIIRSFWAIISGIAFENIAQVLPFATNASYSVCYLKNGKFEPFSYSNDEHLIDVGITKVNLI